MESSSLAEELYSKSSQLSKTELSANGQEEEVNKLGDEDGAVWGDSDEELNKTTDLDREWERRRSQFHTIGYRDGLIVGKEAIAQEGFNIGFQQSSLIGFDWGLVRGLTSAFRCLPNEVKERLIETREKRNEFQALYESVCSLSTTDALKSFHDDIMTKKAADHSEQDMDSQPCLFEDKISDCSLGNYVGKLRSLLLECPTIDMHFSVK